MIASEFTARASKHSRSSCLAVADNDHAYYITDEDEGVHLRLTRILEDGART
jgi:hypothetical protein